MNPDKYQQTLDYLYSFVDYSLTRSLRNLPEKFDLDRMRVFMRQLGSPEKNYPIIHVAGTKGKGSVCALCASALRAAGYKVGLYTSPHLQDYNERIQIDGTPISHETLVDLVEELRPFLNESEKITTFEITTALAFLYFAQQKATAVVAEVGLGGRLDATNIVTPIVSVITSISYDHTQVLGDTLAKIAAEKGGIIKPGVPVIVSPQKDEAGRVFEQIARDRNAPLIQVGRDFQFAALEQTLESQSLEVWSPRSSDSIRLEIPLLGAHQVENAATACAALQISAQRGLPIQNSDIQEGFASVSWPGRFEILRRDPPVVVDAAHNRDSAHRLSEALQTYFPNLPVILVFGASEDKDVEGMLDELKHRVEEIIITRSYHPRAIDPQILNDMAYRLSIPALVVPEVEDALQKALERAGSQKLVLVTGSIFIAAGARHSWYNRIATSE
jgi:dihydrofolate synthase/folylpolyglutamate synthase